jgi:hypothetical protein
MVILLTLYIIYGPAINLGFLDHNIFSGMTLELDSLIVRYLQFVTNNYFILFLPLWLNGLMFQPNYKIYLYSEFSLSYTKFYLFLLRVGCGCVDT